MELTKPERPKLNKNISIKDFRDFYWLKEELIEFCKINGIYRQGGKIEITKRIENFLKTGIKENKNISPKRKVKSKFDWNNESLTLDTVITDNYKNSENVRAFFIKHIGKKFKFKVEFMNWIKSNVGLKLEDAVIKWKNLELNKKNNTTKVEIAPQFEYNRFIRDFMLDNKGISRETAIKYWKAKKLERGDNVYRKSDLKLLKDKIG